MKLIVWIAAAVVILLVVVGGAWMWMQKNGDVGVKKDQYQAVFLTNGQVYFGKIAGINDRYIHLSKIYYLQLQQSVQPAEAKKDEQQQISLAKLGDELHGPEDQMFVARDQVLFWENLKDNGKVVQAIKQAGK